MPALALLSSFAFAAPAPPEEPVAEAPSVAAPGPAAPDHPSTGEEFGLGLACGVGGFAGGGLLLGGAAFGLAATSTSAGDFEGALLATLAVVGVGGLGAVTGSVVASSGCLALQHQRRLADPPPWGRFATGATLGAAVGLVASPFVVFPVAGATVSLLAPTVHPTLTLIVGGTLGAALFCSAPVAGALIAGHLGDHRRGRVAVAPAIREDHLGVQLGLRW